MGRCREMWGDVGRVRPGLVVVEADVIVRVLLLHPPLRAHYELDRLAAEGLTRARCSDAVRGRGRVRGEMLGCGARVRCSGAVPVASQVHAGARRARLRQGARLRLRGIG